MKTGYQTTPVTLYSAELVPPVVRACRSLLQEGGKGFPMIHDWGKLFPFRDFELFISVIFGTAHSCDRGFNPFYSCDRDFKHFIPVICD